MGWGLVMKVLGLLICCLRVGYVFVLLRYCFDGLLLVIVCAYDLGLPQTFRVLVGGCYCLRLVWTGLCMIMRVFCLLCYFLLRKVVVVLVLRFAL